MSGGSLVIGHEATHTDGFDLVFNLHHDYVYGLAHAFLRNAQDAEDVTQDVFLRVHKSLASYQPERASMRTWLTKMAVNACKAHRRRNFLHNLWQHKSSDDDAVLEAIDLSPWVAPEDHALRAEVRRTIRDVLARLRHEQRMVLILHYYLDLSCPEIATILECPEGTVRSRLYYARRMVQAQLECRSLRSTSEV